MEIAITICEMCKKEVRSEDQKRKQNWLELQGGMTAGLRVWLEKPRAIRKGMANSFMHSVGWMERMYHFCSIKCLVKALEEKESI